MKWILVGALVGAMGCGDVAGEMLQSAGEALQTKAKASTTAPCLEDGGWYWAEFPARAGKTTVTVCYEAAAGVLTGPISEPYCWKAWSWWNPSDPDVGWIFCSADTISVTVDF